MIDRKIEAAGVGVRYLKEHHGDPVQTAAILSPPFGSWELVGPA